MPQQDGGGDVAMSSTLQSQFTQSLLLFVRILSPRRFSSEVAYILTHFIFIFSPKRNPANGTRRT